MLSLTLALLAAAAAPAAHAAPAGDRRATWPGYTGGDLDFELYSGYLSAAPAGTAELFYVFATSKRNATSDPVLFWTNGGPGCSSLYGFARELGPFFFDMTDGAADDAWVDNEFAWNRETNLLVIENPAGVGFSYSSTGDLEYTDEKFAAETDAALRNFFELFPEYAGRETYLSGESYAGIYVPMIASAIVDGNAAGLLPAINYRGFLVGNAIMDKELDDNSFVPFAYGKSLLSEDLYAELEATCEGNYADPPNKECVALQLQMNRAMGNINRYNVLFDCENTPPGAETFWHDPEWRSADAIMANIPCIDTSRDNRYFNDPEVRAALGVRSESPQWEVCSSRLRYTKTVRSVLDIYVRMVEAGYRVLSYTGDVDLAVTYLGTYRAARALGFEPLDEWHPWSVDGQVAGYAVNYAGGYSYITFKGLGHMVPEDSPERAYVMLEKFLAGEQF